MNIQNNLDEIYEVVVLPLQSFTSKSPKGSLNRVKEYMTVFGDVMIDFGERVNTAGDALLKVHPDKREEIQDYILELRNKIVATYKPK